MKTLRSFVGGRWIEGREPFATLVNPATEEPLARTSSAGIDFGAAVELGRSQGAPALRELTFAQRGALLGSWSKALHAARDELIALSMENGGNTRSDAKFDIDGAIATLAPWRAAEIGAGILPGGAFQFICGSPGDLLDRLGPQDVVAFTGSSQTAAKLREQLARRGARLNVEADSLNAAVLGPDVQTGSATWGRFVQDVVGDMRQKRGA